VDIESHSEIYKGWAILLGATEAQTWLFYCTPLQDLDPIPGGAEYPDQATAIAAARRFIDFQEAWGAMAQELEDWFADAKINSDEYHGALEKLSRITYFP
jgi:hypothetical protein